MLYPVVYRHAVHVNPLVIVLAVLFMADLGGIAGAILAVPAAAAGHIVVGELLRCRGGGSVSAEVRQPGIVSLPAGIAQLGSRTDRRSRPRTRPAR